MTHLRDVFYSLLVEQPATEPCYMNKQNSMFMKNLSICLTIVGILISGSCAVTDVAKTSDLAKYKSFGWGKSSLDVDNPVYKSELIDANIKASIKKEFASKGVHYTAKKPDLLVSYKGYTEIKEQSNNRGWLYNPYYYPFPFYGFFPFGIYGMGGPLWVEPQGYYSYTEGTLIIDMRDTKTGKLVWRGTVQGSVEDVRSLKKNITRGIKAIMKKYPERPVPLIPLPKEPIS